MATLSEVLEAKGSNVFTADISDSALETLKKMAAQSIGSAIVMDGEKIAGIMSERDFIRKVVTAGGDQSTVKMGEIMSSRLFFGKPDSTVEECMQMMTTERIRHLPVIDGEKLVGLVSIGDVVKFKLTEQEAAIRDYQKYIYQAY